MKHFGGDVIDFLEYVETLAERLGTRGFHATEAFSGNEAVEKFKAYNFDVTILNVKMPGMSGIEALEEIKKLKPLTEVLMLTGHGTIETAMDVDFTELFGR